MDVRRYSTFPSLATFCLYSIAKNLDNVLFRNTSEQDVRTFLYVIGPTTSMSCANINELMDMLLKRSDQRFYCQRLEKYFRTHLRTSHLYCLLHQGLTSLTLLKCGSLLTTSLLSLLSRRRMQLASLALGGVNKSVSRQSLCDFIASCGPTLKTIRLLDSQRVDGHVVSTVAETCKKLLVLSLSGCSSVREDDLMPLCNAPLVKSLVHLDLSSLSFQPALLRQVCMSFSQLVLLNASEAFCDAGLDDDLISWLPGMAAMATLRSIDISHSDVGDRGLEQICNFCPELRQLVLRGCDGLTVNCFASISKLEKLREVSLSSSVVEFNRFNTFMSTWTADAARYPPTMRHLTKLSLHNMYSGGNHPVHIDVSDLWTATPCLESLELIKYNVDFTVVEGDLPTIWPCLQSLTLEQFDQRSTYISENPLYLFLEALPPSLQSAHFGSNSATIQRLATVQAAWPASLERLRVYDPRSVLLHMRLLLERFPRLSELTVVTDPLREEDVKAFCQQYWHVDIVVTFNPH